MPMKTEKDVRTLLTELEDWACFACAPHERNPDGMNLVFEETERGAKTIFKLAGKFQSYPGYLHGGIVSSVLDETMAYVGVFKYQSLPFTKRLQISYRTAVHADMDYLCEAFLEEAHPARYTSTARIVGPDGRIVVTGESEFVVPSRKMAAKMLGESFSKYANLFRE